MAPLDDAGKTFLTLNSAFKPVCSLDSDNHLLTRAMSRFLLLGKALAVVSLLAIASLGELVIVCPNSSPNSACTTSAPFVGGSFVFLFSLFSVPFIGAAYAINHRRNTRSHSNTSLANTITFNCQHCGAPVVAVAADSVVTCRYCGESMVVPGIGWNGRFQTGSSGLSVAPQPSASSGSYLDWLADKLRAAGYSVNRNVELPDLAYKLDIFARKRSWELSKFGYFNRFMVATQFAQADRTTIEHFSEVVADYALDRSALNRESSLVMTVVVMDQADGETKKWISETKAPNRWQAFELRVLVCLSEGRLYFYRKTPIWGAAYYSGFMRYIEDMLTP